MSDMPVYYHSVRLDKEKCKGCTNCIKRCPTQAIRVRNGQAVIVKERCIDCGECIRVCPHHAKYARRDSLAQLQDYRYCIALPAPSLYGQFANLDDVDRILNALLRLGFHRVFEVSRAAELVSDATRRYMNTPGIKKPVISGACPAVVRLIRVRFPDLLENLLPLHPPMDVAARMAREEARQETGLADADIGVFFITPCPAKVTAIKQPLGLAQSSVSGAIAINDIYPLLVREMDHAARENEPEAMRESGVIGLGWATSGGEASGTLNNNALSVDGIENCMHILEELETGMLDDIDFIELNACQGGCVGGALTAENPFVAKTRLLKLRKYSPISCNRLPEGDLPDLMAVTEAITPNDAVMRLADNVTEAMARRARLKELLESFPGLDCGTCGAPSCRALAEDIVRGYASELDCVFRAKQDLENRADANDIYEFIPAPFREKMQPKEGEET